MAGSRLGTLAKVALRRVGAGGGGGGAVVVGGAGPGGGVRAYHAAPTSTTMMITAIAICVLLFKFRSTPEIFQVSGYEVVRL